MKVRTSVRQENLSIEIIDDQIDILNMNLKDSIEIIYSLIEYGPVHTGFENDWGSIGHAFLGHCRDSGSLEHFHMGLVHIQGHKNLGGVLDKVLAGTGQYDGEGTASEWGGAIRQLLRKLRKVCG